MPSHVPNRSLAFNLMQIGAPKASRQCLAQPSVSVLLSLVGARDSRWKLILARVGCEWSLSSALYLRCF